jgi:hypothetical protein
VGYLPVSEPRHVQLFDVNFFCLLRIVVLIPCKLSVLLVVALRTPYVREQAPTPSLTPPGAWERCTYMTVRTPVSTKVKLATRPPPNRPGASGIPTHEPPPSLCPRAALAAPTQRAIVPPRINQLLPSRQRRHRDRDMRPHSTPNVEHTAPEIDPTPTNDPAVPAAPSRPAGILPTTQFVASPGVTVPSRRGTTPQRLAAKHLPGLRSPTY